MKKNLRIVSAAAAALLAVAPVAATAMPVNAANITNITISDGSAATTGDINIISHLAAVTKPATSIINNNTGVVTPYTWDGKVSGTVSASFKGQDYTVNLPANYTASKLYTAAKDANGTITGYNEVSKTNGLFNLTPNTSYYVEINGASLNLGSANANLKDQKIYSSSNDVQFMNASGVTQNHWTTSTDQNGATGKFRMLIKVTPTDVTNTRSVSFYQRDNGNEVPSGSLTLNANSNQQLNVQAVVNAFNAKYGAHQFEGGNSYTGASVTTGVKDVTDQLNKLGMTVDANGYFTANKSFTLNFSAKSNENGYTATLPVTVSVPNGKDTTPASVAQTGTVTIMHAAYTYEIKDGKLGSRVTSADTLHAYSSVPVYGTTTVNGKTYYRVSATQPYYINAGNVDGTTRTLNHNSYVYNNKGKRVKSEGTWKKGSSHKTYGAAMNIRGSRMYRVNKNRYVKVVNFDK